ncbi:hypothetical protein TSAR_015134, partial [Trichomalopsis sarcophagae]
VDSTNREVSPERRDDTKAEEVVQVWILSKTDLAGCFSKY